jgi:pilus assembly protein CpaE
MSTFFTDEENGMDDPAISFGDSASAPPPATGEPDGNSLAIPGSPAPAVAFAVAVVESDPHTQQQVASLLGEGVSAFATLEELASRLTGTPVVAVLGPSSSSVENLGFVDRLLQTHRELGAILVANELSTALLQQALRVGVRDVLAMPVDTSQLVEAVQRVASGLSVATADGERAALGIADDETGRVVTVFSTKGGAGKSVIATNLAVLLAERSAKPVCLVDADLQFGDIAVMLKLAPQHTIVDAVGSIDRLDIPMLQSLLATHESSGLLILPAPLEPAFADQIGASEMVQIVETLRKFCSFVVIDTPAYFNDVVLGLIETSDDVLLVAGMDIPNIKNVKIGLQTLRLLNTPMEKLRLILNRANSKVKLDVSEVERTLQVEADSLIPSDVVVPQSVNKGVPVVQSSPKSGVSRALQELADMFIPIDAKRRKR